MRFVNYQLTPQVVKSIDDYYSAHPSATLSRDVAEDLVAVLMLGPNAKNAQYLIPMSTLRPQAIGEAKKAGIRPERYMRDVFNIRSALYVFADTGFVDHYFYSNESEDLKVKAVLDMFSAVLVFTQSQKETPTTGKVANSFEDGGSFATAKAAEVATFDLLSSVSSMFTVAPSTGEPDSGMDGGNGVGVGAPGDMRVFYKRSNLKVSELASLLGAIVQDQSLLFKLASAISGAFSKYRSSDRKETHVGEQPVIRSMRKSKEITDVVARDNALPDEAYDGKLARRKLVVRHDTKEIGSTEIVYFLGDISGSMRGAREVFMKATCLAYCKDAVEQGKKFYCRLFNDQLSNLIVVTRSNYAAFIKDFVPVICDNGTNIHMAMLAAQSDISSIKELASAEIVLVTDGTEQPRVENIMDAITAKKYAVLINKVSPSVFDEYAKAFDKVLMSPVDSVEEALNVGLDFVDAVV